MLSRIPEVALYFGHDCAHSCKEWCQSHLVAIPRVNRLASFGEYQKVLSDLIKLLQTVLYLNIEALRVYVIPFKEKLYGIDRPLCLAFVDLRC